MLHHLRTAKLCALFVLFSALSSCSVVREHFPSNRTTQVRFTIDEAATILPAQYDKTYLLEGNVIARYEDFDFMRVAYETVPVGHPSKQAGTYSTFEIHSHDGEPLKQLNLSPQNNKQLLRFRVNGKNYFIQEGASDGSYSISRPAHLFALHYVTP